MADPGQASLYAAEILLPLNAAFFPSSHQTRNRQNQYVLISPEPQSEESERRSGRRTDMQMHRHEDQGMFSQRFCELAMPRCKLQRCCANIGVCWTAKNTEREKNGDERETGLTRGGHEEMDG